MKFSEFKQYQPKQVLNVFGFVCEDAFLVEESRPVWQRVFSRSSAEWISENYSAKEFDEIPAGRLMDEALTPSLFAQNRILFVKNADKVTKGRLGDLAKLQEIPSASLRVVLVTGSRKLPE